MPDIAATRRSRVIVAKNQTYVAAFSANAAPTLTWAMTIPAIAGPIKRAELKTIELIANAEGSAGRSTRFEINAMREGWAKELVMPSNSVSANSHSIVMASV